MWVYILIAISMAAGIAFLFWLRRRKKRAGDLLPSSFAYHGVTPMGVQWSSIVPVPAEAQTDVDTGIGNQIRGYSAAKPEWLLGRTHSEYRAYFIEPMGTSQIDEPGAPTLIVGGIQTAGTCVGVGNDTSRPSAAVIPHQQATNWRFRDYLMRTAWHESEHIREWKNDPALFWQLLGANDVHPRNP